ncbi:hypothetical protein B6N60_02733 [Richelia sinica FACHB-800]|uniref:DUF4935 domain-containing protein n=1 Tax=Richelia sinica FACHB-800 TaxID=1357546 RepID=A0A975Y5A2_9NOST|nr:PIN domain-containing protein [Richelia sinica]MBD2667211.1 DUF4935 domain-containing protein [Richelia sinica FACHB-800]QXE24030.1 hypothetical protein B6N60_02733 [Richelia sinica FACHB-800]
MELDELKKLVRAGHFGAITLDTSIFDAHGLKLESGLIRQLEQFRDSSIKLIISEVVKEELLCHLIENTKEAKKEIEKSLRQARDYWQVEENKIEKIKKLIFDGNEVQEIVNERFNQFIKATSLEIIEPNNYLTVSDLIHQYFHSKPPFSETGKKKSEFPDAIALISLEVWANKNNTKVIVVTSDNDWKRFCQSSDKLFAINDFAGALGLFQFQDAEDVCRYLSEKYELGYIENIQEAIWDALELQIYNFDIYIEADSYYRYEEEVTEIKVNGFQFKLLESPNIIFRPVNFDHDSLTVESILLVDINVECNFFFAVYDSIDKEDVGIGGNTVKTQADLDVEVLITFVGDLNKIGAEFDVDDIEIEIQAPLSINFGFIEPDWGDGGDDY